MLSTNLYKDLDHITSPEEICKILKKKGFRKLGEGAYSWTYGKKEIPFVVKVNHKSDPASYKYYSMIGKSKSRYFPKIYKLKLYVSNDGEFLYTVFMERLKPLSTVTWKKTNEQGRGLIYWMGQHPDSLMDEFGILDPLKIAEQWEHKNKNCMRTLSSLINSVNKFATVDFHEENVMIRLPHGDAVLTDPICSY